VSLGKSIILSLAVFGSLGLILAVVPAYSPTAALFAAILSISAVIITNLAIRSGSWQLQVAFWEVFLLFFTGMAFRAWLALLDNQLSWMVVLLMLVLHVAAWCFPWLTPRVSARLTRLQFAPTSRAGRFIQLFSLSLIPGIGGLALLVQRLTQEDGLESLDTLLIAIIGSVVAIGAPQAISHQFWEKKPWSRNSQTSQPTRA
jgi:hypothetical protein